MTRNAGVHFLRNECAFDPPLSEAEAQRLWQAHRARVEALPDRSRSMPRPVALTTDEQDHALSFRQFVASQGIEVLDVIKLDLSELTVLQHFVVSERSEALAQAVQQPADWLGQFLPLAPRSSRIRYSFRRSAPVTTQVEFDLPHAEFVFQPDPRSPGSFALVECLHHATVMHADDRTFLTTGYHRSFGRMISTPVPERPTGLVALVANSLTASFAPEARSNTTQAAERPSAEALSPWGRKAARFGDFLQEGLFFEADLIMRRFQLQLTATVVALNERRNKARALGRTA
jgi:hypothetical protein